MIMGNVPTGLSKENLVRLYEQMMLLRRCESISQKIYREGKLPGFIHLYIGQEAVAVGVCAHLRNDDWITSTHRGHGHVLAKGVPPRQVLAELAAKKSGCSGGRGGTMHMFSPSKGVFGTNGIVGGGLPLAVGLGLSAKVRQTDQVAVCFFGDGAVNHGAFHEAVNFAGIQNAPVIFVCENNLYATCVPFKNATRNPEVSSKAAAYGIPGVAVDGNDVLAVWDTVGQAVQRARTGGGPTLVECKTYRTVGHHEGDPVVGTYRTQEEIDQWKQKCPVRQFRLFLLENSMSSEKELDAIDKKIEDEIERSVEFALSEPAPDTSTVYDHVFADPINPAVCGQKPPRSETVVQGWMDAVRDGIAEEMRRDPHTVYFGEGIGERGGTFGHTKGLWQEFGGRRIIDTPISELGFTGSAIGASATGCRAISDLMMSDFLIDAGNQIVHQAAKLRYMSNGQINVPVVIRASCGAAKNSGAHHSAMYHPIWSHIPGLIVAVPSNPADAKGLMKTALRAADPVIFLEHKLLLSKKGPVPVGEYYVPFGQANIARAGNDITMVSCSFQVSRCLEAAESLEREGISCEVIDLRTIVPLDVPAILQSVRKTGRLLVVDEGYSMCGLGAEIAAIVMEQAFDALDAPAGRLHMDPVTHPVSPILEEAVALSVEKIMAAAKGILAGKPPVPKRVTAGFSGDNSSSRTETLPEGQTPDHSSGVRIADGVPFIMPNQDLTITEATVVKWLKNVGDPVRKDEGIVEVETDKATFPVESPLDGILVEILVKEGTVVALGGQMGTIKPS
jgi:2-oxoisovalerate dehydrogenase E1 component